MPTEKDVKELGESRDSGVKQLADSDAVETGFTLATGNYKMKGGKNGKWCRSSGNGANNNVACNYDGDPSTNIEAKWKIFRWQQEQKNVFRNHRNQFKRCEDQGNKWRCNQYALKGGKDNKYCADEGDKIRCNRDAIGQWEK